MGGNENQPAWMNAWQKAGRRNSLAPSLLKKNDAYQRLIELLHQAGHYKVFETFRQWGASRISTVTAITVVTAVMPVECVAHVDYRYRRCSRCSRCSRYSRYSR